jgi:hypothetical protein
VDPANPVEEVGARRVGDFEFLDKKLKIFLIFYIKNKYGIS